MHYITVQGHQLEYVSLPSSHPRPGAPTMVFLHEGLGSISMWRDFPQQVADATGCKAIVYSRRGYGRSAPLSGPRPVTYMHDEALQVLPEFLDQLGVDRPILFGHSDGGSIALIHAGGHPRPVSGLVVMAPHYFVEPVALENIAIARQAYETGGLRERLARYHKDVDSAFRGWNDTWLHPDFKAWNIESYLSRIQVPVMAIQGEDDEYATMIQIDGIAQRCPDVDLVKLADCRHSPHKDQPQAVIEAVTGFVGRLVDGV